jgi:hypothetical protein
VEEIHDCASGLGREAVIRTAEYLISRQSRVLHNLLDKQSLNSAHDLQPDHEAHQKHDEANGLTKLFKFAASYQQKAGR